LAILGKVSSGIGPMSASHLPELLGFEECGGLFLTVLLGTEKRRKFTLI
jgi:hypothetical protein